MPVMDGGEPRSIEDYWKDLQAYFAAAKNQMQGLARGFGFGQQSQWQPPKDTLTEDDLRLWMGDKPVNAMGGIRNFYDNKVVPFWQGLKKP